MKKIFVLDTNVLLHDSEALHSFEDNDVVIPIYVIEEIDTFKKDLSELGRNARRVSRVIDGYRTSGSLSEGVMMGTGGLLRVLFASRQIPRQFMSMNNKDDQILAVAFEMKENERDKETIFITMDTNLRIRANAIGIYAQDYIRQKVTVDELYPGYSNLDVFGGIIDDLFAGREASLPEGVEACVNQYFNLRSLNNPSQSALARVGKDGKLHPLAKRDSPVWGIVPRNREQRFALDLLMDDSIKLVTLVGKAGTGKTLLAVAAGLSKVTEENVYDRLLVSRPIFPLGKDIGFLPGTVDEKLNPWMQPIHDSVDFLLANTRKERKKGGGFKELQELGFLEIEPLTYIRGRSIPKQFLVVDESQNLTPHEVKTIITRAGEGTKIILTGDPYQIDQPYLDSMNNGLTYTLQRMKGLAIAGTMTLAKGERSVLAELAADRL